MANFKTHIAVSGIAGVGFGITSYAMGVGLPTSLLSAGLCGASGMLPDMDTDSRSLREVLSFAAVFVSVLAIQNIDQLPTALLTASLIYLFIRFALGKIIVALTNHRGMFHSIPAAIIAGEIVFLLFVGPIQPRLWLAGGVILGYLSHLCLDELYGIGKASFGSALKIFGNEFIPNLLTYSILATLTFLILYERMPH